MNTLSPTEPPAPSERATALLDAAMALFAERGYARTSVADIQEAAGLTRGSGALYKHFPSKEAVLVAGLERHVRVAEAQMDAATGPLHPGDLGAVAELVLAQLAAQRAELRIICRDLDDLPELRQRVVDGRINIAYRRLQRLLEQSAKAGTIRPVADPEATAAVLLGALTLHQLLDTLLGGPPLGVDTGRFAAAWADLASTGLAPRSSA